MASFAPTSSLFAQSGQPLVTNRRGRPINPFKKPYKYQLGLQNQRSAQEIARRNQLHSSLFSRFSGLADSPGYSEQEQQDILGAALSGIGGGYGAAREDLANLSARTRNRAGYGSRVMELAREEGREKARAGFGVREKFANEKIRRQLLGLEGLANMYGIDTSFLANLLGGALSSATNIKLQKMRQPGLMDRIGQGVGIASGLFNMGEDIFGNRGGTGG